jgi:ubiquitin carboxyl-terminal hydrolase 4/11/15
MEAFDDDSPTDILQLSAIESVGNLKARCRASLRLSSDVETRFWRLKAPSNGNSSAPLTSSAARQAAKDYILASALEGEAVHLSRDNETLADVGLDDPDVYLAVEQQDADGNWIVAEDGSQSSQQSAPRPNFGGGGGFFAKKEQAQGMQLTPRYKSSGAAMASSKTAATPVASTSRVATRSQAQTNRVRGLVGLGNLGNTCVRHRPSISVQPFNRMQFMNSALQCLSNTPELRDYFLGALAFLVQAAATQYYLLADVWSDELNEDNPLGMEGQVAKAYAALVHNLWTTHQSSYSPREFKQTIGRFRPMFLGWSQQDSQELIAFLLDGLHEDLNRIRKKPYTEIPDWEGEATPERMWQHAANVWDLYRRRNDSVMIDLFFGQFRSTLTCLECGKVREPCRIRREVSHCRQVSYKFDEFSSVTLSLPKKPWRGYFYVQPYDLSQPKVKVCAKRPGAASPYSNVPRTAPGRAVARCKLPRC